MFVIEIIDWKPLNGDPLLMYEFDSFCDTYEEAEAHALEYLKAYQGRTVRPSARLSKDASFGVFEENDNYFEEMYGDE